MAAAEMEGEGVKDLVIWTLEGSADTRCDKLSDIELSQIECLQTECNESMTLYEDCDSDGQTLSALSLAMARDDSCSSGLPLISDNTPSTSRYSDLCDISIDNDVATPEVEAITIRQSEIADKDLRCGIRRCRPQCLQKCANIKVFIFFTCLLTMLSSALSTGYFNSVITTIEKRFEIGSSLSGLIAASFEFGSLIAIIFVSYFGPRRHVPQLIGIGVVFIGIGALLFTLPHFIAKTYSVETGFYDVNLTSENICKAGSRNKADYYAQKCIADDSGNGIYVFVLIIAMVLIGTGNTPIFTLGITYIDDHVSEKKAPSFIAFIYASSAMGPVVGFGLGALLLQYYVDFFTFDHSVLHIKPDDPRWVGAWWGGFIVLGFLLILISIPFFMFPKHLRDSAKLKGNKKQHDEHYGKKLKDIPKAAWSLLTNSVFIVACFGICGEISIVSGFLTFLAKYLENEFSLVQSVANLYTGGIAIPGAILGILAGGYVMRRFQLQVKGAIQMAVVSNVLALSCFGFFFYLGCDNMNLVGATLPYYNMPSTGLKGNDVVLEPNLTSSCNLNCDCSNNDVELICGNNGLTYFSPCHAGCTSFYADKTSNNLNFSNCACITGHINTSLEVFAQPMAKGGACDSTCQYLKPFMVLLFIVTFLTSTTQMPLLMVIMRSVSEKERSFALGTEIVFVRLFAYIPAPIMFGNTIDTACLLWNEKCGEKGSCLIYDIEAFRYKYIGIVTGLKVLSLVLFIIVIFLLRRQKHDIKSNTNSDRGRPKIAASATATTFVEDDDVTVTSSALAPPPVPPHLLSHESNL